MTNNIRRRSLGWKPVLLISLVWLLFGSAMSILATGWVGLFIPLIGFIIGWQAGVYTELDRRER